MTHKKIKKPWPTKKAMEQVYEMNLWGGNNYDFYSGEGSHESSIITPYLYEIKRFLTSFNPQLTVCDLGCGDFNIGKQLVEFSKQYIAIDIVEDLINRNKDKYKSSNLEFQCMDIASDDLPLTDCVILRQVLQHLSNNEVIKIVQKLNKYKFIILTEHVPEGKFIPNINIISGQGIRLKKNSGINLMVPPFNLKVKNKKEILSTKSKCSKGLIVTTIYNMF